MAEIKIEKKKPVWPWILLAVVILGVVAYLLLNDDAYDYDDDDDANEMVVDSTANRYDSKDTYKTNSYDYNNDMMAFDTAVNDSTLIGTDSTYTKSALVKLANLVVMKADQNNLASSNALENLRTYSKQMDTTMNNSNYASNLNSIGNDVTTVIQTIQTKSYPNLNSNVSELKESASKLNMNEAADKQSNNIRDFFEEARDVLKEMN